MLNKENTNVEAKYFHKMKYELVEFCEKCDHIFLYGAGRYGEMCFDFLKKQAIDIEGFIVTNKQGDEYLGIPTYTAKDKIPLMSPKTGIVFSLKKSFQEDIKRELVKVNNVEFLEIEDCFFEYYRLEPMIEIFQEINAENPVEKNGNILMDWRKILIVRLDSIGDMIWTTAFIRELKRNFPKSEVTIVMRRDIYSLMESCPYIDNIFLYDCGLHEGSISKQMEERAKAFAQKYLLKEEYDVVFLPRPLPRSSGDALDNILLAMYSGAKYRIGRADYIESLEKRICIAMENMFSVVVKHTKIDHEILRILKLLEVCGGKIENDKMELWLRAAEEDFAEVLLKTDRTGRSLFIAVAPVSNDKNRSWNALNYINLINNISSKYGIKIKFILLGGKNAIPIGKAVEKSDKNVLNLINKTTLSQAAAVIKHCDIYLGANTGLLHMAAAFEKPIIEISAHLRNGKKTGGIAPERTGAWRVYSKVIQPTGLEDCKDWCKKSYAHCINQITIQDVQKEVEKMIAYVIKKESRCKE